MDMKHPAWRIPSTIAITIQSFEKQDKTVCSSDVHNEAHSTDDCRCLWSEGFGELELRYLRGMIFSRVSIVAACRRSVCLV